MAFVEMRRYRLKPGGPQRWAELYKTEGAAVQRKHLGEPVGYYRTEVGPINEIIHMWRYETLEERAEKRAALFADADWLAFIEKISGLIDTQDTQILYSVLD